MASMKQMKNMSQFLPSALSLGTVEGKVFDREEVVTVDMYKHIRKI